MATPLFENTTRSPRTYFGVTLQPGEQKWIDVPPDAALLADALSTTEEHNHGQPVWVEAAG